MILLTDFVKEQTIYTVGYAYFEVASRHERVNVPLEGRHVGLIWSFILEWISDIGHKLKQVVVTDTTYLHTLGSILPFCNSSWMFTCLAQRLYSLASITDCHGHENQFWPMRSKQMYCVDFSCSPVKRVKAFSIDLLPKPVA